jgi:AcrR family transcriptional regulator
VVVPIRPSDLDPMTKRRSDSSSFYTPGPRPEGAEAVRARLMDAALRLGPEELTIRELAKDASVSPRMPIYVFGSVPGLHAAVAAQGFEDLNRRLEEAMQQAPTPGDALRAVAVEYLRFGMEEEKVWRTMHSRELWTSISDNEERERANRGSWVVYNQSLDGDVFEAVSKGRERALAAFATAAGESGRPEPDKLVQVLTALIDGFLWQTHFEQERASLREYAQLIDRVIAGWQ